MTDTHELERQIRAALASIHEATERCVVITDHMIEALPAAEVRVALAELTDLRIAVGQLVAHAYGGPKPKMTNEAQAVLARTSQEARRG